MTSHDVAQVGCNGFKQLLSLLDFSIISISWISTQFAMERHRREERGQHKHQSKTADTHRGERKHQSSTNATGRGHRREELKIQERHYSPELLPTVTALSGDDNYVRRWLAKTEAETKQERAGHRRHSDSIPSEREHNFPECKALILIDP